jgi:hypothetical protein
VTPEEHLLQIFHGLPPPAKEELLLLFNDMAILNVQLENIHSQADAIRAEIQTKLDAASRIIHTRVFHRPSGSQTHIHLVKD